MVDVGQGTESARLNLPGGFSAPHGLKLRPPQYQDLFTNCEEDDAGMVVFRRKSEIVLRTLVVDATNGAVAHRIETGSPLALALGADGKQAWVSNVLIPPGMFGPDFKPRDGGVVMLDLTTFRAGTIPAIPDANGLAVVSHL